MSKAKKILKETKNKQDGFLSKFNLCLLYTSDAADERSSVDLGGRRIIKKKKNQNECGALYIYNKI